MDFSRASIEEMVEEINNYERSVKMLDAVIGSSFDGLWICDGMARVIRIDKACEKNIGMKADGRRLGTGLLGENSEVIRNNSFGNTS